MEVLVRCHRTNTGDYSIFAAAWECLEDGTCRPTWRSCWEGQCPWRGSWCRVDAAWQTNPRTIWSRSLGEASSLRPTLSGEEGKVWELCEVSRWCPSRHPSICSCRRSRWTPRPSRKCPVRGNLEEPIVREGCFEVVFLFIMLSNLFIHIKDQNFDF